jgi:hypothetical protein
MVSKARSTASIYSGTTVTVFDDISGQFNGVTKTFTLSVNGAAVSLTDAYQIQIFIGGARIFPYRSGGGLIFFTDVNQFSTGYTVSGSTITFANAPSAGIPFNGMLTTTGPSTLGTVGTSSTFSGVAIALDD